MNKLRLLLNRTIWLYIDTQDTQRSRNCCKARLVVSYLLFNFVKECPSVCLSTYLCMYLYLYRKKASGQRYPLNQGVGRGKKGKMDLLSVCSLPR